MSNQDKPAKPYSPAPTPDSGQRIAHALEHIAAQMSEINEKLGKLTATRQSVP